MDFQSALDRCSFGNVPGPKAIAELMLMAERDQLKDWADFGARVYQHADTIRKIIAKVEKGEE